MATTGERYWRVRMKVGEENLELSRQAWDRDEVGVWYGGWSAKDFAVAQPRDDALAYLNSVPGQRRLGWQVSKSFLDTCRRFAGISEADWVVIFFEEALHLARVVGGLQSKADHPLNSQGEIFKFRRLAEKKSFRMSELPDSYRLIPMAGRGNVNQFGDTGWTLVRMLAESSSAAGVRKKIAAMALWDWLDVLGPRGWESLCLGYLIIREAFVPTGLIAGGTLPVFDIAGRSLRDGARIVAQCKKNPGAAEIDAAFLEAWQGLGAKARAYYFAYGGCVGALPAGVTTVGKADIERDAEQDEAARRYLDLFRG